MIYLPLSFWIPLNTVYSFLNTFQVNQLKKKQNSEVSGNTGNIWLWQNRDDSSVPRMFSLYPLPAWYQGVFELCLASPHPRPTSRVHPAHLEADPDLVRSKHV